MIVELLAAAPLFAFGRDGGNIQPQRVTLDRAGLVAVNNRPTGRKVSSVARSRLERLAAQQHFELLPARIACAGTLPDIAWRYVAYHGHVVRVHGGCNLHFDKVYAALSGATHVR